MLKKPGHMFRWGEGSKGIGRIEVPYQTSALGKIALQHTKFDSCYNRDDEVIWSDVWTQRFQYAVQVHRLHLYAMQVRTDLGPGR